MKFTERDGRDGCTAYLKIEVDDDGRDWLICDECGHAKPVSVPSLRGMPITESKSMDKRLAAQGFPLEELKSLRAENARLKAERAAIETEPYKSLVARITKLTRFKEAVIAADKLPTATATAEAIRKLCKGGGDERTHMDEGRDGRVHRTR